MYSTIKEIKDANKQAGQYFFSKETMEFFQSLVCDGVWDGRYFITSENDGRRGRRYAIREAREDGSIKTVASTFYKYKTEQEALTALKDMIYWEKTFSIDRS